MNGRTSDLRNIALVFALATAACGNDGKQPTSSPSPSPSSTPITSIRQVEAEVLPASIATLSLDDLEIDPAASVIGIEAGTSGISATDIKLISGQLRILTPGDGGQDHQLKIRLSEQDGDAVDLLVTVRSTISSNVTIPYDTSEEEDASNEAAGQPDLKIEGVDGTRLSGGDLRVSVPGGPALDADLSSAYIIDAAGGRHVVSTGWTLDTASNSFVVQASQMSEIMAPLPSGAATLVIGLRSIDGTLGGTWERTILKGSSIIQGSIVSSGGQPSATLVGRRVALVGRRSGVRQVAVVQADGTFARSGLPVDTYDVQLLDIDNPGFVGGFVPVFTDGSTATAQLIYGADATSASLQVGSPSAGLGRRSVGARAVAPLSTFVASARISRSRTASIGKIAGLPAGGSKCGTEAGDVTTFEITSGAENATQRCEVSYVVPQGTSAVELKVTVTSDEFPQYTADADNPFDDQWSFAFSGAADLPSASDSVNQSHRNSGTLTRTKCIDTATLAKNAPATITGLLKAANIGDDVVSTTVRAEFTAGKCGLQVTSANMSPKNAAGYTLFTGLGAGAGPFLPFVSIPTKSGPSGTGYGVPLTISYAPKEAALSKVELGIIENGKTVIWSGDILSQASSTTPGILKFKNFVVPRLDYAYSASTLSFTLRLTGTISGEQRTSPDDEQNLSVAGSTIFTPLYLAGDEGPLSTRRYNSPHDNAQNPGGDSWATRATINWLVGNTYRFDDISGLHVARVKGSKCKAGDRAVLGHCGHGNGSEVDLRYYDPDGTFPIPIGESGGAGLSQLLSASQKAGPSGSATARLVDWVTRNRAMITAAAAESGTLKIHFGKESYFTLLLCNGRYPDGTPITYAAANGSVQSIGKWTAKPAIATEIAKHDTHWHITRRSS